MPFGIGNNEEAIIRRYPVAAYFAVTFLISWTGALAVAAPHLVGAQPLPRMAGILMFPVMLLGPSLAGIAFTRIADGKSGLRALFSQVFQARVAPGWYTELLIPPLLVLAVLLFLQKFVSPVYEPNRFFIGILFAIPAGFLEEIGWTGYAFPKMCREGDALGPSIGLGLLWSLWHLPVINYLGTTTPHGAHWLQFFFRVQLGHDGHARANRVDLYEHEKPVVGSAHACKLDRLPCRFRGTTCNRRPGSDLVCRVWNCSLGSRRNHCQDIRQTVGAARSLGVRTNCVSAAAPPSGASRNSGWIVGCSWSTGNSLNGRRGSQ
jgi:membrane protease YdiL (CAAX protease family)